MRAGRIMRGRLGNLQRYPRDAAGKDSLIFWRKLAERARSGKKWSKKDIRGMLVLMPTTTNSGGAANPEQKKRNSWYYRYVNKCVENSKFEDIHPALELMQKTAWSKQNLKIFNHALKQLQKAGRVSEIEMVLQTLEETNLKANDRTYELLMQASLKSQDHASVLRYFNLLRGLGGRPSPQAAYYLLASHARSGSLESVAEAFELLRKSDTKLRLSNYVFMTALYAQKGDISNCLKLMEEMKKRKMEPGAQVFQVILKALQSRKNATKFQTECNALLRTLRSAPSSSLTTPILNGFLRVFSRRKEDWQKALDLHAELSSTRSLSNLTTYGLLASLHGKMGRPEEVKKILAIVQQMPGRVPTSVYNGLIDAHGRQNDLEEALAVYKNMEQEGVKRNVCTYNNIIMSCVRSDRALEASPIFIEMIEHNVRPTIRTFAALVKSGVVPPIVRAAFEEHRRAYGKLPNAVAYEALISIYLKCNEIGKAVESFEEMMEHEVKPSQLTYNALVSALIENDEVGKAVKIYRAMRRRNFETGYAINESHRERGDELKQIVQTLSEMGSHSLASSAEVVVSDTVTFSKWIAELGDSHDLKGASQLIPALKKIGIRADVLMYNALLEAQMKCLDVNGFLSTIEQMNAEDVSTNGMSVRLLHEFNKVSGDDRLANVLSQLCES